MKQLLKPIPPFVYCNRQAAAGRGSRCQKAEISIHQQPPAQLNAL